MIEVNFRCTEQHEVMHDFRLRRGVNDIVALVGRYTAFIVTDVSEHLVDPLKVGPIGCTETSVTMNAV
jgi:hypothetical protein